MAKKYVYAVIYNEDAFDGIAVPAKLLSRLEEIESTYEDIILEIHTDYREYRDCEVEYSHQAREGSSGTRYIDTVKEFEAWFAKEYPEASRQRKPKASVNRPITPKIITKPAGVTTYHG